MNATPDLSFCPIENVQPMSLSPEQICDYNQCGFISPLTVFTGNPWHQDASYWKLTPARTVTAWLAIDDVDESNSAMRFLPESHNLGHLEFRVATGDSALRLETVGVELLGQPYSNKLKAGQVSLHADMLVHGSLPNMSDKRRCGLTIRYCPPEVIFTDSQWASKVEAIVCRGRDPYDRWTHNRRPVGNDVSLANSPHSVGGN